MASYSIKAKVFLWSGNAAWHFTSVPKKESAEIKEKFGKKAKGFGSIPVEVTIRKTKWKTSIFPDKRSGMYLLPLKVQVRRAEGIDPEDTIEYSIKILR